MGFHSGRFPKAFSFSFVLVLTSFALGQNALSVEPEAQFKPGEKKGEKLLDEDGEFIAQEAESVTDALAGKTHRCSASRTGEISYSDGEEKELSDAAEARRKGRNQARLKLDPAGLKEETESRAWGGKCDETPPNIMAFMKEKSKSDPLQVDGGGDVKGGPERLGFFLKVMSLESGGNITDITSMDSKETKVRPNDSTDHPESTLPAGDKSKRWQLSDIDKVIKQAKTPDSVGSKTPKVAWNKQTNFGLWQMSADQLGDEESANFHMFTHYMELAADTTSAAGGAANNSNVDKLIAECGSKNFFPENNDDALRKHFHDLASCRPGMYTPEQIDCFAKWTMSCPYSNLMLAMRAKPAYFATWKKAEKAESSGACAAAIQAAPDTLAAPTAPPATAK